MIACLVSNIDDDEIKITGDDFIHLNSSLRVKEGDEILLLNGKGLVKKSKVIIKEKKFLIVKTFKTIKGRRNYHIDLLLAPPKREALNDCLRGACELGIRKIYLFSSEYVQNKKFDLSRAGRVLKSSLEQSNNPFLPEIESKENLSQIKTKYERVFICHPGRVEDAPAIEIDEEKEYLLLIGPEGGFSDGDLSLFRESFKAAEFISLPSPILRTPTAVSAAMGYLLARI